MNTARIYHDIDGNEKTIFQMVKLEPTWAAVRIQEGERAIKQLAIVTEALQMEAGCVTMECCNCKNICYSRSALTKAGLVKI